LRAIKRRGGGRSMEETGRKKIETGGERGDKERGMGGETEKKRRSTEGERKDRKEEMRNVGRLRKK
jgi:hypothetical protein